MKAKHWFLEHIHLEGDDKRHFGSVPHVYCWDWKSPSHIADLGRGEPLLPTSSLECGVVNPGSIHINRQVETIFSSCSVGTSAWCFFNLPIGGLDLGLSQEEAFSWRERCAFWEMVSHTCGWALEPRRGEQERRSAPLPQDPTFALGY